jgi:predicted HicB family RNase H-like nuclease
METRGRPKLDPTGAASKYLTIRVAEPEHDTYREAAERAELTLSEWIRDRLSKAAQREAKKR